MKSHEVLHEVIQDGNAKQIAEELGMSIFTLYKWAQDGESHRKNPLERLVGLIRATNDLRVLHWLCEQHDGFFVPNRRGKRALPEDLFIAENEMAEDYGKFLTTVGKAAKDKSISREEAKPIRSHWERLKSVGEKFVVCCEEGDFQPYHQHMAALAKAQVKQQRQAAKGILECADASALSKRRHVAAVQSKSANQRARA